MESQVDTGIFAGTGSAGWRAVLLLLNAIPDPAWIKDAAGRYVAVNPAYLAEYRGRTRQHAVDVVGKCARDLHAPVEAAIIDAEDEELLRAGGFVRGERITVDALGRHRHFEINRFVLLDDDGHAAGTMGIARDISERVALTESLRESERKLATLVGNLPGTVLRFRDGREWQIDFVSAGVEQLTGYPAADFATGVRALGSVTHPADQVPARASAARQLARSGAYTIEYRLVCRDGGIRHIWERGAQPPGETRIEAYAADVTEAHERMERLAYLAAHDELTGLANRRGLVDCTRQALSAPGHGVVLAVINLDRFKRVNDSLGHELGDRVLCEISARLRDRLRPGDGAARLGADSFALLLIRTGDSNPDERIAGILEALRRPISLAGREVGITASAGCALYPEHAADAESLLRCAEVAMTLARASGRDRHVTFAPGSDRHGELRIQTIADLRRAIDRDQLSLHYQPMVDARSGKVVGIEALLRWQHPERGDVPPADFVPLAEESGLIVGIGEWVLREACGELMALRAEGLQLDHVAINLSLAQLRFEGFADCILEGLRQSGLDAGSLALEVTESCAVLDAENVLARLRAIKALGVALVMDDFGTGYSSLAQLRRFPVDRLKLDRQFVHATDRDPVAVRICEVVTGLAHALGLKVIAEGVETPKQRELLQAIGCDLLQGFLLAPPLPPAELRRFLSSAAVR